MQRYSDAEPIEPTTLSPRRSNRDLFDRVAADTQPDERVGALLLAGARDVRSIAVRQAQSVARFDRRASYWSHAALVSSWKGSVARAVGVECTLTPGDPARQVPERNGVTPFALTDYADDERWPNLALCTFELEGKEGKRAKAELARAARSPLRDRIRFPLWEWLGVWGAFGFRGTSDNPLERGVPHPAAALCESAYDAIQLDLTPGAAEAGTCPEVLWATVLRWYGRFDGGRVRVFRVIRDPGAAAVEPLDETLDPEAELRPRATRRGKRKTKKGKGGG